MRYEDDPVSMERHHDTFVVSGGGRETRSCLIMWCAVLWSRWARVLIRIISLRIHVPLFSRFSSYCIQVLLSDNSFVARIHSHTIEGARPIFVVTLFLIFWWCTPWDWLRWWQYVMAISCRKSGLTSVVPHVWSQAYCTQVSLSAWE